MKEHISIGTILHALHRPVCLIDKLASQVLEERTSITLSQFMLLMVLKEKGTICQRESADMLGLTQAAISRQLIGLNKKRFIKRKIDPKNRRAHTLVLTSEGRLCLTKALKALTEFFESYFKELDQSQRKSLLESLAAVTTVITHKPCIYE
jgi:DNA-binding MarR family transcriptional regulator